MDKMNNHYFARNYSESDLMRLINEGEKKRNYINRLIDTGIHINMISESNLPLEQRIKYARNEYNINEKNYFNNNIDSYNNNINQNNNYKINNIKQTFRNNIDNEFYHNNINNNEGFSILNKPFHPEKRHFPLINNKGNFFKNMTPFLIGNTQKIKLLKFQNDNQNNRYNYINNFCSPNDNKKNYNEKFRRSSSVGNIHYNHSKIKINDINNYNHKIKNSDNLPIKYKYYNPRRYDYESSRYGDNTYNYYLNSPMRGDISKDWKFPPLYYCNTINKQKKNNSNY